MFKIKKVKLSTNVKKIIVLCSMVGLLVVTGVLNFVLNKNSDTDPETNLNNTDTTVQTFFTSYRADRETARAEEISYLDAIIATDGVSQETLSSAEAKKLQIMENIEQELIVESLIKAKGFNDAVVIMSTNNVNVIVSAVELTSEEVSQILSVILKETSYTPSDVIVVSYSV